VAAGAIGGAQCGLLQETPSRLWVATGLLSPRLKLVLMHSLRTRISPARRERESLVQNTSTTKKIGASRTASIRNEVSWMFPRSHRSLPYETRQDAGICCRRPNHFLDHKTALRGGNAVLWFRQMDLSSVALAEDGDAHVWAMHSGECCDWDLRIVAGAPPRPWKSHHCPKLCVSGVLRSLRRSRIKWNPPSLKLWRTRKRSCAASDEEYSIS
jgi:hypothetical protein